MPTGVDTPKFLNDLAADKSGRIYVSDMVTNSIWVLDGGKLSLLTQDDALDNPNGLLVEDGRLVVASWGKMAPDFSTKVPGHMKAVDLATKKVSALGDSTPAAISMASSPMARAAILSPTG